MVFTNVVLVANCFTFTAMALCYNIIFSLQLYPKDSDINNYLE